MTSAAVTDPDWRSWWLPASRLGRVVPMATIERDTLKLTIHFEEDAGEGWILAAEVPGAISQARTWAEARANVIDALQTVLTDEQLSGSASSSDDELLTLAVAE